MIMFLSPFICLSSLLIIHDLKAYAVYLYASFTNKITMRTLSVWQLLFSLFLIVHSRPDWNFKTPISDTSSNPLVDNGIDFYSNGLATTEGANELAQVPDEGDGMNSDAPNLQGSGCTPDTDRLHGKMRTRRGDMCSPDRLQLNNNGASDRQSTPTTPKSQQQQPGQSDGGSEPERRNIILPDPTDPLPNIFLPEKTKPRKDPDRCYQRGYFVPVCAKESDQYLAPGSVDTYILDPCNPCMFYFFDVYLHTQSIIFFYLRMKKANAEDQKRQRLVFPLAACLPTERAYCCLITAVAYVS